MKELFGETFFQAELLVMRLMQAQGAGFSYPPNMTLIMSGDCKKAMKEN
jgi:hypothetical protein